MNGILVINKPSGPTSFSIVAEVRRLTVEKRVGHGGTLDPLASGVLPVFLGQATRLVEYLQEYPKTYRAGIIFGVSTDTYDAEGKVTGTADASGITRRGIEALLPSFLGNIQQTPPAFTALKKDGQPMYKLARKGLAPQAPSRLVTIYRLEIVDFQPPLLTLDIECSKGTYIRSLAHDLGRKLGVGAHLKSLIRTAYGPFDIKEAITLDQLREALVSSPDTQNSILKTQNRRSRPEACKTGREDLASFLHPLDVVLSNLPSVTLTAEQEKDIRNGKQLSLPSLCHPGGRVERPKDLGGGEESSLPHNRSLPISPLPRRERTAAAEERVYPRERPVEDGSEGVIRASQSPDSNLYPQPKRAALVHRSLGEGGLVPSEAEGLIYRSLGAGGQPQPSTVSRAYTEGGIFFALLRLVPETGLWQPEKVFN